MNLGEYATNKKFTVSQLKNASGRYTHMYVWYIIIIIKGIYIAHVRKGHKCAMSAEMAVWLRNCLYLYSYLSHN